MMPQQPMHHKCPCTRDIRPAIRMGIPATLSIRIRWPATRAAASIQQGYSPAIRKPPQYPGAGYPQGYPQQMPQQQMPPQQGYPQQMPGQPPGPPGYPGAPGPYGAAPYGSQMRMPTPGPQQPKDSPSQPQAPPRPAAPGGNSRANERRSPAECCRSAATVAADDGQSGSGTRRRLGPQAPASEGAAAEAGQGSPLDGSVATG